MSEQVFDASIKRIVISEVAVPFVSRGGRLFSGQVISKDPGIEAGDQVLVVDKNNNPITMVQVTEGS